MAKHAFYLASAYPNEEDASADDDKWIDDIATKFNEAERDCNEYAVDASRNPSNVIPDEIKKSAKICKIERMQLETDVNSLEKVMQYTDAPVEAIKEAQREMKEQLARYRAAQRSHMMIGDDIDETESKMMQKMQDLCVTMNIDAEKKLEKRGEKQASEREVKKKTTELKIERMKEARYVQNVNNFPLFIKWFCFTS